MSDEKLEHIRNLLAPHLNKVSASIEDVEKVTKLWDENQLKIQDAINKIYELIKDLQIKVEFLETKL